MIFAKTQEYVGSQKTFDDDDQIFPVGLSKVTTDSMLSIAYIDRHGQVQSMFVLNPGQHRVSLPAHVHVVVSTAKNAKWSVRWPSRFEPSDPNRISAALVSPKSQKEEMQDYLNEIVARALSGQQAQQLRDGTAEFDPTQDDYSEYHEDDHDSPLSVYQMQLIMDQFSTEIEQKRHEGSPPAEPLLKKSDSRDPQTRDIEEIISESKAKDHAQNDTQKKSSQSNQP